MAHTGKKRRTRKNQKTPAVRPVFLMGAVFTLVGFGIVMGVSLDLVMRMTPAVVPPVSQEKIQKQDSLRQFRPPQFLNYQPEGGEGGPAGGFVPEFLNADARRAWTPDAHERTASQASPLVAFAVSSSAPAGVPVVAIVIDDMGLDRSRSLRMIELDGPLTVSLMTYANGLPELTALARKAGHEVMGHLPMEPVDPNEDPGPGALMTNMNDAAIRRHLADYLDEWQGYVGINNHMGSKFTADAARMSVVMQELNMRGLMWLDSKTTVDSVGSAVAAATNVPYVERDIFLDNVSSVPAVLEQLTRLESAAQSRGFAVGIGHPHDATIDALGQWLPTLRGGGIALVPLTGALKRRLQLEGKRERIQSNHRALIAKILAMD